MALGEENGGGGIPATMLVGPAAFGTANTAMPYPVYMGGMGGNSGGMGGLGSGDGWGILVIILILAALGGGFGGNNGGGGFLGNAGNNLGYDFPWLMSGQQGINNNVSDGFRDAQLHDSVTSVRDGISNLSTQLCNCCGDMQMSVANGFSNVQQSLCNGFAGTTAAITGAQNALTQQMYTNQIAELERSFAAQTASTQGMTALQSQLAQCCCDNRLATESLRATVLSENCQDRYEAANNTRDIIDSQTRGTQAILDKLCSLELDNYRRENDNLRTQLNMASLAASQTAQTAQIRDGQVAAVSALVNELRSCPIPSQPVYGSQPIFTCSNNNGCGCGCNGGNF